MRVVGFQLGRGSPNVARHRPADATPGLSARPDGKTQISASKESGESKAAALQQAAINITSPKAVQPRLAEGLRLASTSDFGLRHPAITKLLHRLSQLGQRLDRGTRGMASSIAAALQTEAAQLPPRQRAMLLRLVTLLQNFADRPRPADGSRQPAPSSGSPPQAEGQARDGTPASGTPSRPQGHAAPSQPATKAGNTGAPPPSSDAPPSTPDQATQPRGDTAGSPRGAQPNPLGVALSDAQSTDAARWRAEHAWPQLSSADLVQSEQPLEPALPVYGEIEPSPDSDAPATYLAQEAFDDGLDGAETVDDDGPLPGTPLEKDEREVLGWRENEGIDAPEELGDIAIEDDAEDDAEQDDDDPQDWLVEEEEEDEEDKPGAGWVRHEHEASEDVQKDGLIHPIAIENPSRCRGRLEDGSLCLRKATDGRPYCPEHAAAYLRVAPVPRDPL